MGQMGKYCKAYPIGRFREFTGWKEDTQNLRKDKTNVDEKEMTATRELTDDDHLYLQEKFVVTDGVFMDENIIFDDISPEWIEFCKSTLKFEVPVYQSAVGAVLPGAENKESNP